MTTERLILNPQEEQEILADGYEIIVYEIGSHITPQTVTRVLNLSTPIPYTGEFILDPNTFEQVPSPPGTVEFTFTKIYCDINDKTIIIRCITEFRAIK